MATSVQRSVPDSPSTIINEIQVLSSNQNNPGAAENSVGGLATADHNFFQMIQAMTVKNTISSSGGANDNNADQKVGDEPAATTTNNSMIPQNLMWKMPHNAVEKNNHSLPYIINNNGSENALDI